MKTFRLFGLAFAAVLAMSVVAVSAASAAPEFTTKGAGPVKGIKITGKSASGALETSNGSKISCTANSSTSEITGASTIGKVVVKYTGCKGKEGTGSECPVNSKSPKGAAEEIIVNTTKGELGSVAKAEATTQVGVLFKPETGTTFVSVEGSCLVTAPVNGSLAGEATPVLTGSTSTSGKLEFIGSAGKQHITSIKVAAGVEKPKLVAFSGLVTASLKDTENLTFSQGVEVT